MDGALRAAAQAGDTGAVRALILRNQAKQRAAVGLGLESDLSALQLASLYDDEAATLRLESGVACDLPSACALGLSGDITRLAARGDLGAVAEHLTPMGFALTKARLDAVQALLKAGDDPNRPLRRIAFFVWEVEALAAGHGHWSPLQAGCRSGSANVIA